MADSPKAGAAKRFVPLGMVSKSRCCSSRCPGLTVVLENNPEVMSSLLHELGLAKTVGFMTSTVSMMPTCLLSYHGLHLLCCLYFMSLTPTKRSGGKRTKAGPNIKGQGRMKKCCGSNRPSAMRAV